MEQCPSNPESVNYIGNFNRGQNNPYSNSYNPGWRNHPNFSWGGNQGVSAGPRPSQPPGFQQQMRGPPPPEKRLSMEDMFAQFMQSQQVFMQWQQSSMRNV